MMRITRRTAALVVVAALAVGTIAAAPAGAGSDGSSPNAWAASMCTSVKTWFNALGDTLGAIDGSDSVRTSITKATNGIGDATRELVNDLGDLGLPQVEGGKHARQAIRRLGDQLEQDVRDAKRVVAKATDGPLDLAATFAGLGDILSTAIGQVADATRALKRVDAGGELRKALTRQPACTTLRNTV